MKIVQVSSYYPPRLGGQENAVQNLALQLVKAGKNVEVVTSDSFASPGVTTENGVKVTRLKSKEFANTAVIWGLIFWLIKNTHNDTIVHLHVGQAYTPEVVWLASKLKRFKYIMHMHIELEPSSSYGKVLPIYKKIFLNRVLLGASAVVVLNEEHKRIIIKDYKYKKNVYVMNNGINDDCFQVSRINKTQKRNTLNLLFVGRLSPQKNLSALIVALSIISNKVRLDVLGDGKEQESIKKLIVNKRLKNVRLHGRASRAKVLKYYAKSDVLILPSLYEAQPLVLLEAMAARIPIIATNVIGSREIVKGVAIIVEPTPEGIAEGIEVLLNDPKLVKRNVELAYRKSLELRWSKLVYKYEELYEKQI